MSISSGGDSKIPSSAPHEEPSLATKAAESAYAGAKVSVWAVCKVVGGVGSLFSGFAEWLYPEKQPMPLKEKNLVPKTGGGITASFAGDPGTGVKVAREGKNLDSPAALLEPDETEKVTEVQLEEYIPPKVFESEAFHEVKAGVKAAESFVSAPAAQAPVAPRAASTPGAPPPPPPPPPMMGAQNAEALIANKYHISTEEVGNRRQQLQELYKKTDTFIRQRRKEIAELRKYNGEELSQASATEHKRAQLLVALDTAKQQIAGVEGNVERLQQLIEEYQRTHDNKVIQFSKEVAKLGGATQVEIKEVPIQQIVEEDWLENYQREVDKFKNGMAQTIISINKETHTLERAMVKPLKLPEKEGRSKEPITVAKFFCYESELRTAEQQKIELVKLMDAYGIKPRKEEESAVSLAAAQQELKKALQQEIAGLQKKNVTSFNVLGEKKL
jgi:hypothetical protein